MYQEDAGKGKNIMIVHRCMGSNIVSFSSHLPAYRWPVQ